MVLDGLLIALVMAIPLAIVMAGYFAGITGKKPLSTYRKGVVVALFVLSMIITLLYLLG